MVEKMTASVYDKLKQLNVDEIKHGLNLRSEINGNIVTLSTLPDYESAIYFQKIGETAYEVCLNEYTEDPEFDRKGLQPNFIESKTLDFSFEPLSKKTNSLSYEFEKEDIYIEELVYNDYDEKDIDYDVKLQDRLNIMLDAWLNDLIEKGHSFISYPTVEYIDDLD